jgi:hypothetical protein
MPVRVPAAFGRSLWALTALLAAAVASRAAEPSPADREFFEKQVRPVLAAECWPCHSAAAKQRGGLTLDSRAGVLKGGDTGPAVVPGKPEESRLVKAINYKDDLRMPKRGRLADEQVAALTEWVRRGVPFPDAGAAAGPVKAFDLEARKRHWAWQPIQAVAPPEVKRKDWPRTPIDRFVLAKLEAAGLEPAPPADKRTLLRRVTFDLTGLPPTPEEIDAFLRDDSPDAYEKVVDRLLASPRYGERWGRHWLDLVRYAETCGHEYDFGIPEAYQYRDYVIRAFNADVPYDEFVTEHLAGDLVPTPRRNPADGGDESILGTGFWFLGEAAHSPVDLRADGADRRDNQIDVFGKAFLGLTLGCARCHDHKFDAITQRDYYALCGYLQSSRFQRAFLDDSGRVGKPAREIKALHDQARDRAVARSAAVLGERFGGLAERLTASRADAKGALAAALKAVDPKQEDGPFAAWSALTEPRPATPEDFAARRRELVERRRERAARAAEAEKKEVVFADFRKDGLRDWFVTGDAFAVSRASDAAVRADAAAPVERLAVPGAAHSGLVSGRLQGALRSPTFTIGKKKIWYHAAGKGVRFNLIIDGYQLIRDPIYGGLTFTTHGTDDRFEWYGMDVAMWAGLRAYVEVLDDGDGSVALDRIVFSDDGPPEAAPNAVLTRLLDDDALTTPEALAKKYQEVFAGLVGQWRDGRLDAADDAADRVALLNALLSSDVVAALPSATADRPWAEQGRVADLLARARRIEADLPAPRRGPAMADGTGVNERLHIRGSSKNLGDEVPRRFLEALAGPDQPPPESGSGRLELARRLLDPSDPLPARVMVNRLWLHHFGEGIVRTPDDFGVQGERPTDPELLDWLASEFVRRGWSLKAMHRLMVLSSAYRMASQGDPKTEEADPQNKLLHRMPMRRLEAEAVRDAMLTVSGRLDAAMYGPGVPPYLTPYMVGRGRPAASGPLDGDGRRSVYLAVRRNFLNPMLLAFDYPTPFTCIGRRNASNVPAQALTLLNDPFVVQQAKRWAERELAVPDRTPRERVADLYVAAFGRPPTGDEADDALAFLEQQGKEYGKADDPRAWADLCHVLFNVKEFIFVN